MWVGEIATGRVASYDEEKGLGEVVSDGGEKYGFHCSAVTDGTRHVEERARVVFAVRPAHFGRLEAYPLLKLEA